EPAHAIAGAPQVEVVPEPSLRVRLRDPRLLGVELPWMEIESGGLSVNGVDPLEEPARHRIRQQPEVSAAAGRPVARQQPDRRHGHLQQSRSDFVRETRRIGNAVVIVANRVDARAVTIAGVCYAIERPRVLRTDGKARSPITAD